MRIITREEIPCWYEISWDPNIPAIILQIHEQFLQLHSILNHHDRIQDLQDQMQLREFVLDYHSHLGFQGCLENLGVEGNFRSFRIPIPAVVKKGNWEHDFGTIKNITATLCILTPWLGMDGETTSDRNQLLIFRTVCVAGFNGHSVAGAFSKQLVRWMAQNEGSADLITEAMKVAWFRMEQPSAEDWEHRSEKFRTKMAGGFLHMTCPGHGCGIDPDDFPENKGYRFGSHNVDGAVHQLTMLAGLAALHDLARKEV